MESSYYSILVSNVKYILSVQLQCCTLSKVFFWLSNRQVPKLIFQTPLHKCNHRGWHYTAGKQKQSNWLLKMKSSKDRALNVCLKHLLSLWKRKRVTGAHFLQLCCLWQPNLIAATLHVQVLSNMYYICLCIMQDHEYGHHFT